MAPQEGVYEEALARLRRGFEQFGPLSDEAFSLCIDSWQLLKLGPGEHLLAPGDPADRAAFVLRGVLREYYVNPDGTERNKAFPMADGFCGSLADLLSQEPGTTGVTALTDAELLVVSYREARTWPGQHVDWARIGQHLAEHFARYKAERERALLSSSPEDRYRDLRQAHPEIIEQVPQHHIASYLGITPEALSRIRRRMRQSGDL